MMKPPGFVIRISSGKPKGDIKPWFNQKEKLYSKVMDLKQSCTAEERVVAVVGDWGWFYRVNEVAEHPPMGPNKNCAE